MASTTGIRDLKGLTALVTGASRGTGSLIAQTLAREGMHLVITARRAHDLERAAVGLRAHGGSVAAVPCDLSRPEEVELLARRAAEATGAVDVLVNNAGMACMLPFHRTAPADLRREIEVNLAAPVLLTRLLLPGMLRRARGHIVNIASLGGEVPLPYEETYGATKAGLILFSKSLRAEYRGTGVSASVLMPGVIWGTGMVRDFEANSDFKMPRSAGGCTPEQIARAVVRVILRDIPEMILNRPPVRPLLALLRLFPRLTDPLLRKAGIYRTGEEAARANLAHGGRLTGVSVCPEDQTSGDPGS